MSPEDILNQALTEVGFARPIGDIFEGTPAAIVGLEIYGQTRDEVLRHDDWPFARRTLTLALLKSALVPPVALWNETSPPPPWRFSYAYPADCIFLRYLRSSPFGYQGGDPLEPLPVRWAIGSDAPAVGGVPAKVILADMENPLAVYTARITDPAQWEPLFLSSVVKALAAKYVIRFGQPSQGAGELGKQKGGETGQLVEAAGMRQG